IFKNNNFIDIKKILGKTENLEQEAINLLQRQKNKYHHFDLIYNKNNIELIKNNNPLLEVLNVIWLLRGEDVNKINTIMKKYCSKKLNDSNLINKVDKYKMDYVDKYKLSLMFLLAHYYREQKLYYSFNTFCYLSSGIVGNFIELCRKTFLYANFEDPDNLINNGTINSVLQNKATKDIAQTELQMISRIPRYGGYIYRFILNLGNIFRQYHIDPLIKYPENNQFSVNYNSIKDDEIKNAFRFALRWSVIQKKPNPQKLSSEKNKRDVFTISRILTPIFEISYRTRGGYSLENYNEKDISTLMREENVKPKFKIDKIKKINQIEIDFE
ncbi:MAG TPA: hypothetical protein VGB37_15720, partial [Candidatus Lokiarchaeia archaeon]